MNYDLSSPPIVARRLPLPSPDAFFHCPLWTSHAEWAWQERLYHWALNEARAVASQSLPERDLLGAWN
jgi:hypothetical protein